MRASIKKNTNKAISSSEESWGSLRPNTMVKFGGEDHFYTIGSCNKVFYIKEFEKIENSIIKIKDFLDIDIIEGDCVKVSYKEYELLTVLASLSKGKGYKISDILSLEGGVPVVDASSGEILCAKLIVSNVSPEGEINQLRMENSGRYIQTPAVDCKLIGGQGQGASVKTSFKVSDKRLLVEKTINKIEKEIGFSRIYLDSNLPDGVSLGKISIEKWEMLLTSNYVGETKINEKIEFLRDFSPFLKIPFLAKGNAAPEAIYNLAIKTIDKALQDMQDQINKIK